MNKVKLVLYVGRNIVKNGVSYWKPEALHSVSRDASYEQLVDHICSRLKIDRTTHEVQLFQQVAIRHGGNMHSERVPVNDNEAVQELLANTEEALPVYVQITERVNPRSSLAKKKNPRSRDEYGGRQVKRQRCFKVRTVLEKYVAFMENGYWRCNFCARRSNSRPNRIVAHLTCSPRKGIRICPRMSPPKKEEIENELEKARRDDGGGVDDDDDGGGVDDDGDGCGRDGDGCGRDDDGGGDDDNRENPSCGLTASGPSDQPNPPSDQPNPPNPPPDQPNPPGWDEDGPIYSPAENYFHMFVLACLYAQSCNERMGSVNVGRNSEAYRSFGTHKGARPKVPFWLILLGCIAPFPRLPVLQLTSLLRYLN